MEGQERKANLEMKAVEEVIKFKTWLRHSLP